MDNNRMGNNERVGETFGRFWELCKKHYTQLETKHDILGATLELTKEFWGNENWSFKHTFCSMRAFSAAESFVNDEIDIEKFTLRVYKALLLKDELSDSLPMRLP